jgi:quercetin dioxygenase-like cupin family protein
MCDTTRSETRRLHTTGSLLHLQIRKGWRQDREISMRLMLSLSALALTGCASAPAVHDHWIHGVTYAPIANATGMNAAFVLGAPTRPGLYTIRVHITDGALMPPHSHPDDRMITVLSGVLHYGFGTTADPSATKVYPAGSVFVAKANDPHYAIGKGEAVYQESGMAPTGTKWVGQ